MFEASCPRCGAVFEAREMLLAGAAEAGLTAEERLLTLELGFRSHADPRVAMELGGGPVELAKAVGVSPERIVELLPRVTAFLGFGEGLPRGSHPGPSGRMG